jgi:hypothetical protein
LLAFYDYDAARTVVDRTAREPDDALWQTLSGLAFWGGSGAVWEVEPFHFSHPNSSSARGDYQRCQELMIELASLLRERGSSDLAEPRVASFFSVSREYRSAALTGQ